MSNDNKPLIVLKKSFLPGDKNDCMFMLSWSNLHLDNACHLSKLYDRSVKWITTVH